MADPKHPEDKDGVADAAADAAEDIAEEFLNGGDRPDPTPGPPATIKD